MKGGLSRNERGVSEIYGTFLIISVVLVMAVVLVGIGWVTFGALTDDTDDELVRQSMLEFDDRVDELTGGDVSGTTTMSFPDGSGDDIEANPEAGTIELIVETNETVWNAGQMSDLLTADERVGTNATSVGNLVYEGSDGTVVAYEGGSVWEKQDGQVTMLTEPGIGVTDTQLQLSFVDISDIEFVQEGEELTIGADPDSEGGAATGLMETVRSQTRDDAGNLVSEADITLNITSEFWEGWADYAESGMAGDVEVERYPEENTVEIAFGTFGENLENVPAAPDGFDDPVIYTGLGEFAPHLYNETYGELAEVGVGEYGFEVESTAAPGDEYTTAILYDDGDGLDWWVYEPADHPYPNEWVNAEEPNPAERNISATAPEPFDIAPTGGTFGFEDGDVWTCVIAGDLELDDVRDVIGSDENGCLQHPVDVEETADHAGDFAPFYQVTEFTVLNESGVEPDDVIEAGEELDVDVEVENVGSGDATEEHPVALLQHTVREQQELHRDNAWILDGEATDLDQEQTFTLTQSLDTTPVDDASYYMTLGTGTAHYAIDEDEWDEWLVRVTSDGEYNITGVDVHDDDVEEGETVEVDATIENEDATDGEEQLAIVRGEDGRIVSDKLIQLDEDEEELFSFSWETQIARDGDWENITVETADDVAEAAFNVTSIEQASDFQVHIGDHDETVQSGENVTIDVSVENQGTLEDSQVVILRNDSTEEIPPGEAAKSLTLDSDQSDELQFVWQTLPNDEGNHTLRIETEDHSETVDVTVEEVDEEATFAVDVLESNSPVEAGEELDVTVEVENVGNSEGTQTIWLETFDGMLVGEDGFAEDIELEPGESTTVGLTWETTYPTDIEPSGADITVFSRDDEATEEVVVFDPDAVGPEFEVEVLAAASPVVEGDALTVEAEITNVGEEAGEYDLVLEDFDGQPVNVTSDELDAGESTTVALDWVTLSGDAGEGNVTVASGDDADSTAVEIEELTRDPVDVVFVMDETGSMGSYNPVDELDGSDLPYTVQEQEVVVFEDEPCDGYGYWNCQDWRYDDSEWFIPGDTITQDDWDSFLDEHSPPDARISVKEVAGGSAYCGDHGCFDPYGDRIKAAQAAISGLDEELGDRAGVLEFDVDTNVYQDMTNDLSAVEESLRIAPDGGTDISLGLDEGETVLETQGEEDHEQIIILLTDGEHNQGDPQPEDFAQTIAEDITIYSVGFGGANEEQLQEIAEGGSGEGDQYWAEETDELEEIFDDIIDEVTDTPEYTIDLGNDDIVVTEGEPATLEVTVTNDGNTAGEQPVALLGHDGNPVDGTVPESLGIGESTTLELTWDTSGTVDWDDHDGDAVVGDVTVLTPDDNATATVTIEEPAQPFYSVAVDDVDDPVGEGSTLTFDLTVTNEGETAGEQTIWIQSDTGRLLSTSDAAITLEPGESTDVTVPWETEFGDRNVEEVIISTADEAVTAEVNVTASGDGTFQLDILETNEPVDVGEELEVTANVTNAGDIDLTAPVTLTDIHDSAVDMRTVSLDAGESGEVVFTWQTGTGDDGTGTVELETWDGENSDEATVTVEPIAGDGEFVVEDSTSNATDGLEYIYENQTLEVTATVTNVGNDTGEQIIELVVGGNTVAVSDPLVLPEDESEDVTFELDGANVRPTVEEVVVSSNDDDETHQVDIRAIETDSFITVDIETGQTDATEHGDAIEAGDPVLVTVTVELDSEAEDAIDPVLSLNRPLEDLIRVDLNATGVSIDPGESETFVNVLEWQTLPWDGNDDSQSLIVQVRDASDEVGAWVEETDEDVPGGPAFGDGGEGVDIDIEDVEIS